MMRRLVESILLRQLILISNLKPIEIVSSVEYNPNI